MSTNTILRILEAIGKAAARPQARPQAEPISVPESASVPVLASTPVLASAPMLPQVPVPRPKPAEIFDGITVGPTDRVLFLGASGSGKTQMMFHIARNMRSNYVVFDTVGSKPIQQFWADLPNVSYYDIDPDDTNTIQQICADIIRRGKAGEGCTLMVDEASDYAVNFNQASANRLRQIVRKGRNWGIGWVATSQRISGLNPLWCTQARYVFVARFLTDLDTERLRKWFGSPKEFWQQIPEHQFTVFRDGQFVDRYVALTPDEVALNPTGKE